MIDEIDTLRLRLCLVEKNGRPLLAPELVREKCPGRFAGQVGWVHNGRDTCICLEGRGWVPSQDPWKWFKASFPFLTALDIGLAVSVGELVFFKDFAKALGVKEE